MHISPNSLKWKFHPNPKAQSSSALILYKKYLNTSITSLNKQNDNIYDRKILNVTTKNNYITFCIDTHHNEIK